MTRAARSASQGWRNRLGVVVLSAVALCLVITSGALFMRLLGSERAMDAIVREDAMWAVFQTDRHMRQFHNTARVMVALEDAEFLTELVHHYDILYSRVTLLNRGAFLLNLSTNRELSNMSEQITAFVIGSEGRIDRLDPSTSGFFQEISLLADDLVVQVALTNNLLLGANAAINAMRVDERALRKGLQDQLAMLGIALVFAFIGIFSLLMIQLRRIAYSNQRMRLLQERSRRQAERAKAASKAKSAFLATMSHEIRTPLNGIIGSADLLALDDLPAQPARKLGTIRASAVLLRDLIDNILDFSKLEAGVFEKRSVETDLRELAETLESAFQAQAAERGLALHFDFPPGRVATDNVRLNQLLINLLSNAIKFTHDGAVRVIGTCNAGVLRVEVQDDGIGIAAHHQARLFERFTQIDDGFARQYGGSGLGLAICKQIVTALDGRIGVESAAGAGSVFWFEIPVQDLPSQTSEPEQIAADIAETGTKKVLVVEDNPVNEEVVTGMLSHLGHIVTTVSNGEEAIRVLDHFTPDIVLMDMQMPVMDGVTATREIRALGHQFPIVALTANTFPQDRAACFSAGMTDFLSKPVTLNALKKLLSQPSFAADTPCEFPSCTDAPDVPPPAESALSEDAATALHDTSATCPPEDPTSTNAQMHDLIAALGNDVVLQLVRRFADELGTVERDLIQAIEAKDETVMDDLLHTFKGAALTLGMERSGTAAHDLRTRLPISINDLDQLLALARDDEERALKSLNRIEAA